MPFGGLEFSPGAPTPGMTYADSDNRTFSFPMNHRRFVPTLCSVLLAVAVTGKVSAAPTGEAAQIIKKLNMQKIPAEGPWFTLTYRSDDVLPGASLPARYHGVAHVAGSAIYTVQTKEDFSALHILQTDEIWHFYGGDPLEVLLLYPDGHGETAIIGPDVLKGQHPQFVVPRGVWQGSRPIGPGPDSYTFFANTLAPAFEYADFAIGYRDELQKAYPKFAAKIAELTRDEFATRPPASAETKAAAVAAPKETAPDVFAPGDVTLINAGPGITLRELVGRDAKVKTDAYSIALFTLSPGQGTPTSYNQVSEEIFLITSGRGEVTLDHQTEKVTAGSTVYIKPKVRHALKAAAGETLSFYAISVPAYSHEDYVLSPGD
jgi:predicted cupin superfamily sugar epimerase/mannose-6-phosphate isomerase-like protein (cupin superfamily)